MGLLNFFIRGEQVFFANHRSDIERFAREIAARDVKPELEVYSAAMLEEVQHLLGLDILQPPYVINLVFHTPTQGGTRGTPENLLDAVARIRALGEDVRINVSSMGATQLPMTTIALAMGLNIRVGMEDNVLFRRGEPLENNAQLVERAVRIASELDRPIATPDAGARTAGAARPLAQRAAKRARGRAGAGAPARPGFSADGDDVDDLGLRLGGGHVGMIATDAGLIHRTT